MSVRWRTETGSLFGRMSGLAPTRYFFRQLDSTGLVLGANQVIAGTPAGADLIEPLVKTDTLGRIYLFYRDRSDGLVFGSRFNGDLSVDLAPFVVNDTSGAAFAGPFSFDVYPDGRLVAVWEDYSSAGSTIQMRIYNPNGSTAFGPNTVNSDPGTSSHWVPTVAVQPGSGFVVTWEDYRNGGADIYVRQFNGSGSAVATEFGIVPPGPEAAAQYAPSVGFSSVDKYVISWIDQRVGQEVYLQRFDPLTGLVGVNQLVSSGDSTVSNWDIDIEVSPEGKFLISWGASSAQSLIVSQRFASGVTAAGSIQTMNNAMVGRRWAPSAGFRRANRFAMAWTEFINGDANINFMIFDTLYTRLLGSEIRLNDDTQGSPSSEPSIAAATWRTELVAFTSRRHDDGDIYVYAISHAGVGQYSNQRVNQDSGFTLQSEPNVTVGNNRSFVVWVDSRSINGGSGQRIFGRYGTVDGLFASPDFAVSDSLQSAIKTNPKAVINGAGRALTVWLDQRNGTPQVYGRWLTSVGALDGSEFLISTPGSDLRNANLFASADSVGRFYVVWLDAGVSPPTVKGKWYNADKSSGGSFSYSSDVPGISIQSAASAVNDSGLVSLGWTGSGAGQSGLYLTTMTRAGTVVGSTIQVTDVATAAPTDPSISVDEHNYTSIVWIDRRGGSRQAYYQLYSSGPAAIGANQAVSSTVPEFMSQPATSAYRGRVWFVWADPRQYGLQVYGNNQVYLPTDVTDHPSSLPTLYSLGQNFPNPFNPTTEITFELPHRSRVTLTVYDLLGRQVRQLAGGMKEAGKYRVEWNGTNEQGQAVASGVYFYRLTTAEFSQSRKMLLLK